MRERITEVNSSPGGWPGLLRTVLTTSGPTALLAVLLAIFLGYAVWGRLDKLESNQMKIMDQIDSANIAMSAFVKLHGEIESQRSLLMQSQVKLLRQLCVNSSKNEAQIAKCVAE